MESGVAQHGESPTALLSAGGVNPIYSFDAIYSQIESVSYGQKRILPSWVTKTSVPWVRSFSAEDENILYGAKARELLHLAEATAEENEKIRLKLPGHHQRL